MKFHQLMHIAWDKIVEQHRSICISFLIRKYMKNKKSKRVIKQKLDFTAQIPVRQYDAYELFLPKGSAQSFSVALALLQT